MTPTMTPVATEQHRSQTAGLGGEERARAAFIAQEKARLADPMNQALSLISDVVQAILNAEYSTTPEHGERVTERIMSVIETALRERTGA